jgi:hypothetical protein
MGVIANRTITRGEWLMTYTPAFILPEDTYEQLDTEERRKLQYLAFRGLPEVLRARAEELDRQSVGDRDLIDDIVETNSFAFQIIIEKEDRRIDTAYKFVFPEISVSFTYFTLPCKRCGSMGGI